MIAYFPDEQMVYTTVRKSEVCTFGILSIQLSVAITHDVLWRERMTIRELTSTDMSVYQALMLCGLQEHPESFRISAQDAGEPMVPFASNHSDSFTLGAWLDGGQLAGVVSFARETQEKLRHKGLLYRMYVRGEASGRGIGRKLVQEVVKRARAIEGLEHINLTVVSLNLQAKSLYTSEGFTSFAREERGLKIGESYFDEEQMTLHLFK
ncbi:MAG: GNAT family N-acetyltransferase [Nitrospira sp.]|nr:GNAT family N-acetyltransferase [Nitrospira sp.]